MASVSPRGVGAATRERRAAYQVGIGPGVMNVEANEKRGAYMRRASETHTPIATSAVWRRLLRPAAERRDVRLRVSHRIR